MNIKLRDRLNTLARQELYIDLSNLNNEIYKLEQQDLNHPDLQELHNEYNELYQVLHSKVIVSNLIVNETLVNISDNVRQRIDTSWSVNTIKKIVEEELVKNHMPTRHAIEIVGDIITQRVLGV